MKDFWLILAVVAIIGLLVSVFLDRVVSPWQWKRSFAKFFKDFSQGNIKPRSYDIKIHFDETRFGVKNDQSTDQPLRMSWSEVVKVAAYKRDLFYTDLICVFLSRADQTGLEIHWDMGNWIDFTTSLPTRLPGCKPTGSWLQDITVPAFATKLTELYASSSAGQAGGLSDISRGLSAATPPDSVPKINRTPEGC